MLGGQGYVGILPLISKIVTGIQTLGCFIDTCTFLMDSETRLERTRLLTNIFLMSNWTFSIQINPVITEFECSDQT